MRPSTLTIGQVAALTTVSAKAIRHYEVMGLLPFVSRVGSYRHYDQAHVLAIRLIRQAQDLGFTLVELQSLMADDGCTPDWAALIQAIESKRLGIQASIDQLLQRDSALKALAKALPELIAQSDDCDAVASRLVKC